MIIYSTEYLHKVIKAENKRVYDDPKMRPSVRMSSKKPIQHGVLILNATHLPYGEGVWPAFWLSGADGKWPESGEIDIYEGVGNDTNQNAMSYHTSSGCTYDTTSKQTGVLAKISTDCDGKKNNDEACGNKDPNKKSYGAAANAAGGGVYALVWTKKSIKVRLRRYHIFIVVNSP